MADLNEFRPAPSNRAVLGKLAELLEKNNIDVEDVGRVQKVSLYEGFYKDAEGEAHKVDMAGFQFSPKWESGPEWPVVQQAKPCVVKHRPNVSTNNVSKTTTVLLPDPQIGYRRLSSGELVPLHDEQAMATALSLLSVVRPDRVVHLGDFLDLAEMSSKFTVLPEFALTTQAAIDRGHRFLAECQAAAGLRRSEHFLLEGNHDNRLPLMVARNALSAMRLRQANVPEAWPVMSVPHLLRLEELSIRYVDGYPAGRLKLAEAHGPQTPLYALHGERLSMEKQAKAERVSTVQGHAHHFSMHSETFDVGNGEAADVESWSLGCMCRRDGAVPSTKGGTDSRGNHVERVESWQHGIGVLTEDEAGWDLQPVRIRDGRAFYRDQVVTA